MGVHTVYVCNYGYAVVQVRCLYNVHERLRARLCVRVCLCVAFICYPLHHQSV